MRDKIFYSICFGFILGVLLRSFSSVNLFFILSVGVVSLVLFFYFCFLSSVKHPWGVLVPIFVFAFCFGVFRFATARVPPPSIFESRTDTRASYVGEIVDEPDRRENNQKLTIKIKAGAEKVKILASVGAEEDYRYGDRVKFEGILRKPENFITDQGKEFDYVNYLRKDGIYYVTNYVTPEIISRGNGNKIKAPLFFIKEKFLEKINFVVREPESILMGGLILGERSSFDEDTRQKLVDTGTIHIVALSGYNVTIVSEWIMKVFGFLPKYFAFGAGIFGIFLFVVMAGAKSTAIRAGVMASLTLIARATGRNYDAGRALALAGVAMIAFNPLILAFDVSFQLSFIATVAVIFFAPKVEKYFLRVPDYFKLRDIVSVTCAVYIFVLPFILYKMGNLSLVALPANILILPFIPITMVFGFLTGFIGIASYFLSLPFGFISYLFLNYELGVIDIFSRVPFASFSIPNFPLWLTLLIYAWFVYKLFGRGIREFFKGIN